MSNFGGGSGVGITFFSGTDCGGVSDCFDTIIEPS